MNYQGAGWLATSMIRGNRRLVNVTADGGEAFYTLFRIEGGRIIEDLIVGSVVGNISQDEEMYHYYYLNGERITQGEHNAIIAQHGLDNIKGSFWSMTDQTDEILSR